MLSAPLFTSFANDIGELDLVPRSLYICGHSNEERSRHTDEWEARFADVSFAYVHPDGPFRATVTIDSRSTSVTLRSESELNRILMRPCYSAVYLDITGLEHHIWVPFLRSIRTNALRAYGLYVEPGDYQPSSSPTETNVFDLTERTLGLRPLPGCLSLREKELDSALFVPLLGFEGSRLSFMLDAVEPHLDRIFPIIGVPGFQPEYPFHSYVGNRAPLRQTGAWRNVRYASANCPFSVYHTLSALAQRSDSRFLQIALIGTKPHAFGAVLYYLDHASTAELLYDHPVRTQGRTVGMSRVCIYDLSLFPPIRAVRGGLRP